MNAIQLDLDIAYHVEGIPDDSERFQRAAEWVAGRFGLQYITVSLAIVDDPAIHRVNREHLGHDWPTDAISFVFEHSSAAVDGEIIVSFETAERLSHAAGWSAEDELLLYVIHGLLHLAGLDDSDQQSRREMRLAERACLCALGVSAAEDYLTRWDNVSN